MCGIAGIAGPDFNHQEIDRMIAKIRHRGPDGENIWSDNNFTLGHVRLSIIDLSDSASQPMICSQSGNVLIFNGAIYNYIELRNELKSHYNFKTNSDSEVILAAYLKWGLEFFKKLRGMFALAIYDKAQKKLLIARDRLGIKPFYYRLESGCFLFSSEIKGLLGINNLPHSINESKALSFISFRHLDTGCNTFFNEIKQLPQGSFAWVDAGGVLSRLQLYWELPAVGEKPFTAADEKLFKEKFYETLKLHLRSDVPVGTFLSGGLDSSSVSCVAHELLGKDYNLNTFSLILKNKHEENAMIPLLQKVIKGTHNELELSGNNFYDELDKIIYHHDEPLPDASMYVHYELCKLAKSKSIKVMLSGSGGDELLGGYQSHTYAFFGRLLSKLRLFDFFRSLNSFEVSSYETKSHIFLKALQESMPYALRESLKQFELKKNLTYFNSPIPTKNIKFYSCKNSDPWLANYLNYYKSWTIPPFLHYEDRNSMAFGIEIRVLFLDHELIEFVAQYRPLDIIKGKSKSILRNSLKGVVPSEILNEKSKHGFPAPLSVYTKYDTKKSYQYFCDHVKNVPFLKFKETEFIAKKFLFENENKYLNDFWRILSISVWYNIFFK